MHNSKLVEHLQALRPSELNALEKFIASPFFIEGKAAENVMALFQFLKTQYPTFQEENITAECVFEALFPDQDFVKGKVEKIMSRLFQLLRQFIAYQHANLQKEQSDYWLKLCQFYQDRGMETAHHLAIAQLKKIQAKNQIGSTEDYLQQLFIDQQILGLQSIRNERKGDLHLPATLHSLDQFYLAARLEYLYWLLSQNNFLIPLDIQNKLPDLFDFLHLIEKSPFRNKPLIEVYYRAILFLQDQDDPQRFRQFEQSLKSQQDQIPIASLKALQTLIRIHYVREFNLGKREYLETTFDLYVDHLEAGYLFYKNGLLLSTVRNLSAIGLKLKKHQWVRQFLETYKDRIVDARYPEEVYHFNLANYHFATKNFDQALQCLADTYQDTYYKIAAKRLEIKIYYEQQCNLLEPKMEAFKIYLYRISNKLLPELQRTGNTNFINMLLQIVHPKTQHHQARIQKLTRKIQESSGIAEKEWLLEKLAEKAANC
ncbi:MAG: hypothetical protein AAFP19_00330 [Bacteroidota bacterium]